jgi:hypothetical protein
VTVEHTGLQTTWQCVLNMYKHMKRQAYVIIYVQKYYANFDSEKYVPLKLRERHPQPRGETTEVTSIINQRETLKLVII